MFVYYQSKVVYRTYGAKALLSPWRSAKRRPTSALGGLYAVEYSLMFDTMRSDHPHFDSPLIREAICSKGISLRSLHYPHSASIRCGGLDHHCPRCTSARPARLSSRTKMPARTTWTTMATGLNARPALVPCVPSVLAIST